ncbi:MAG: recombination protein NinB [Bacteroidetes bacterium]|uniref:Recombination protein NinB n=1 Tax=Candidatus Gallipaludibacter merdavium TaxID=2840839 RepID=A0A9D9HUL3_9BACT|nr:recombination protein NinB [Candidatus Gallipaludibacter merdavium]
MWYDGGNELQAIQARMRLEKLIKDGKVFELTEKKPKRSLPQNAYLHVLLGYFAAQTGNTLEWVKKEYYKKLVNPTTFIRTKEDRFMGVVKYLRSSADLDTAEMTTTIDRFRNWSASEVGIYLPAPDEERLLQLAQIEIEKNKEFI